MQILIDMYYLIKLLLSNLWYYFVQYAEMMKDPYLGFDSDSDLDLDLESDLNLYYETVKQYMIEYTKNGNLNMIKNLLDSKYVNNIVNIDICCMESVILACMYGHVDIVKFLVDYGINLNDKTYFYGKLSPIKIAAQFGHLNVISYLVNYGFSIYDIDKECIDIIVKYKYYDVIKYMINHYNNISFIDNNNCQYLQQNCIIDEQYVLAERIFEETGLEACY